MRDSETAPHSLFSTATAPGRAAGISEAMIHRLVHEFYARVRADATLGPIFDRAIGDDWDRHLAKICDFWSSVTLSTGRYKGHPMLAHVRLADVTPAHFERWLVLFRETARLFCPPEAAAFLADRAERIARSLQMGISYQRGDSPAWRPYRL